MPFEIMVDTRRPGGATNNNLLKRLDRLQNVLEDYPEFSRSVSAADATKFAFQAFKNGHPRNYRLPRTGMEKTQFGPWLRGSATAAESSEMAEGVAGLLRGRGSDEQKQIVSSLGVMMDSVVSDVGSRFSAQDDLPGVMTNAMRTYFKWNGLQWWTDTMRIRTLI